MSSNISNVASLGALSAGDQDLINRWFTHFAISFNDPEDMASRLTKLKQLHKRRSPNQLLPGNCDRFLSILTQISSIPGHRHRRDAANIVRQVNERLKKGTYEALLPDPARWGDYVPLPGDVLAEDANDPLPDISDCFPPFHGPAAPIPDVSTRRISQRFSSNPPSLLVENQGIIDSTAGFFPAAEDFMAALENLRAMGAHDPGLHAPLFLDNPREVVMEFPENIELLTAPVPRVDPTLQTAARSQLTIYDTRAGPASTRGALTPDHYIYHLFELFRTKLLEPSVAAKYAIINRAHASRYAQESGDDIADEPPPTLNEGMYQIWHFYFISFSNT
ncbi:hypothetical protein L873DRAFT_770104 [Choiromyces venosus 120613-1]|uniref:Uncharacterized protein n=1 Tax=Choiromyces venosus 120613-1 TaxID=1336337 RepID=A0A3N4JWH4_9PEZI|nr:hypothetical protein L873DRAFT_770104 [Choiromyces venosus 120613-1]